MPRFVALFRGINVGKAKRIAMADLRALSTAGSATLFCAGSPRRRSVRSASITSRWNSAHRAACSCREMSPAVIRLSSSD